MKRSKQCHLRNNREFTNVLGNCSSDKAFLLCVSTANYSYRSDKDFKTSDEILAFSSLKETVHPYENVSLNHAYQIMHLKCEK